MKIEHVAGKLCLDECTALAVCIGVMAFVYLAALCALTRLAVNRARGKSVRMSLADKGILSAAAIGTVCVAYGFFVEPNTLTVTNVEIPSARLKIGDRPIRIVHLSDMHCDPVPRLESQVPLKVAALKPDLIVFTGDAVNAPSAVDTFRKSMKELAQIAPTYAVFGNHDSRTWMHLDLYDGTGVKVLHGQNDVVRIAGNDVAIVGVGVDEERRLDRAFKGVPANAFSVFLHHFPAEVEKLSGRHVDLVCAGHTHGGQVCLPGYGAVITRSRAGKRFESGLYQVDDKYLYVNRGIGMEGGNSPRVRFLAPPEITVLNIVPANADIANVSRPAPQPQ